VNFGVSVHGIVSSSAQQARIRETASGPSSGVLKQSIVT
jgi:hypothetical protein